MAGGGAGGGAGSGARARRALLALCVAAALAPRRGAERLLHVCTESEYHYEYTACDSSGSRWRVAVPHTPGLCTGLPDPVRGTECSFSCKAGEFLEMKAQRCQPCAAGTYSLGTGVRFDEWDEVPRGFANVAANLELGDGFGDSLENCTASTWVPLGDYIASNTDECTATLMYAVNLKQAGTVSFEYIYPDSSIVFEFFVQNDQCQAAAEESRWMRTSDQGWALHSAELSRGNNVLYWRTTAFSVWARVPKPVLLRNVAVTGVAYTSECFPCKPGSFAAAAGASSCRPCPADTFSGKGATGCQPCERDAYAEPGSASCKQRPPCTAADFFSTHSACDGHGETQLMFKWAEPKICSEELPGAAKLPPSGVKSRCPPCNPGFFRSNGSACQPCPAGTFSNGSGCAACPPGTEPALGLEYKWWNALPPNMESTVLSGTDFEYKGTAGWEVAGDYVYTAAGASDNDFLILTLLVDGFSAPAPGEELSRITFVFETVCSAACELYFMVGVDARANTPVETWRGARGRQSYSYVLERNASTSFTWAFQRVAAGREAGRRRVGDVAKLYSVNVTNVLGGVASWCRRCGRAGAGPACAACPAGHYAEGGACRACPPGTVLRGRAPDGPRACAPCGPGTHSDQARSLCYSDCSATLAPRGRPLRYDLSALAAPRAFASGPSFTAKGLKYFHLFNISLCGHHGRALASCADNVTEPRAGAPPAHAVTAHACQAIVVPSDVLGHKGAVSSQPVSLADRLVGVTAGPALDGIVAPPEHFPPAAAPELPDVVFFYRANEVTQACGSGRATAVRLRCNPLRPGAGALAQMPGRHLRRLHLPLPLGDGGGLSALLHRRLPRHRGRLRRRRPEDHVRVARAPAVPRRQRAAPAAAPRLHQHRLLAQGGHLGGHGRRRAARRPRRLLLEEEPEAGVQVLQAGDERHGQGERAAGAGQLRHHGGRGRRGRPRPRQQEVPFRQDQVARLQEDAGRLRLGPAQDVVRQHRHGAVTGGRAGGSPRAALPPRPAPPLPRGLTDTGRTGASYRFYTAPPHAPAPRELPNTGLGL